MHHDSQLKVGFIAGSLFQDFTQLPLDFHAHCQSALYLSPAFAIRTIIVHTALWTLSEWRWRVISIRPSCEIGRTCVFALSRRKPSFMR